MGGHRRLELRPGRGGPGGGSRLRASHAAFPRGQAFASLERADSRKGGSLPKRGKQGAFPSVCSVLPQEAAAPKSPSGAFAGILRISREILRIIITHECDPWGLKPSQDSHHRPQACPILATRSAWLLSTRNVLPIHQSSKNQYGKSNYFINKNVCTLS